MLIWLAGAATNPHAATPAKFPLAGAKAGIEVRLATRAALIPTKNVIYVTLQSISSTTRRFAPANRFGGYLGAFSGTEGREFARQPPCCGAARGLSTVIDWQSGLSGVPAATQVRSATVRVVPVTGPAGRRTNRFGPGRHVRGPDQECQEHVGKEERADPSRLQDG